MHGWRRTRVLPEGRMEGATTGVDVNRVGYTNTLNPSRFVKR
jgi:hypothetical protein